MIMKPHVFALALGLIALFAIVPPVWHTPSQGKPDPKEMIVTRVTDMTKVPASMIARSERALARIRAKGYTIGEPIVLHSQRRELRNAPGTVHAANYSINNENGWTGIYPFSDGNDSNAEWFIDSIDNEGGEAWGDMQVFQDDTFITTDSGVYKDGTIFASNATLRNPLNNLLCGLLPAALHAAPYYCGPSGWRAARSVLRESLIDTSVNTGIAIGGCAFANIAYFNCVGTAFTYSFAWYTPLHVYRWWNSCGDFQ